MGETWHATAETRHATAEKGRAMGGSTARQQAMGETRQATGRNTAGDGGKKAGRWAEARHTTASTQWGPAQAEICGLRLGVAESLDPLPEQLLP